MFNREKETNNPWSPRFRDRLFASGNKSSDQVIQQLRDDLEKQRKMFFDRVAPEWESKTRGFPFSESPRRFGMERTVFPHFEDVDVWEEDDNRDRRQRWPSSGSCRSASSAGSTGSGDNSSHGSGVEIPIGRSDSPGSDLPRVQKPAARSATGDFPTLNHSENGTQRGFRASSAPPPNCGSPRRFTTSLHIPTNTTEKPSTAKENQPNVRHIPIFVEGRDEPVLPRVVEEENDSKKAFENRRQQSSAASKLAARQAKSEMDGENKNKPIPMPFHTDVANPTQPEGIRDSSIPIPLPFPKDARQESDGSNHQIPIPMPYPHQQDQQQQQDEQQQQHHSSSHEGTDPTSKHVIGDDLDRIEAIKRETEALLPRIESFQGYRNDREFLFLDEMLTRLLLRLDNVIVEGRDDIRQLRKEAISSIQRCISLLESKILCMTPTPVNIGQQHENAQEIPALPDDMKTEVNGDAAPEQVVLADHSDTDRINKDDHTNNSNTKVDE